MKNSRTALLGSVAMLAIAAGTSAAQAQVQMPGWFGSVTGWWYPWNDNGDRFTVADDDPGNVPFSARPGDGYGGRIYGGYRFSNPYDIALGLQGTWFDRGKTGNGIVDTDQPSSIRQKAWYWAADLEIGYNGNDGKQFGYRLFAGVRYAEFKHKADGIEDIGDPDGPIKSHDKFRGIGPRIGMSGAYRFAPDSNWSVFADVAGAYLFGRHKASTTTDGGDPGSGKSGANPWNVEGQLGVAYDIAPNVSLAVGYRGEYWSRVFFTRLDADDEDEIYRSGDRLMHGPFVRVSYNIGAPRPAPVAPVAPAPAAVMTKNFIVFFDWDRSNLTAQAQNTIREAAAASKTGGVQRINVTGHADKSGGDQYNMALSLRRANTVRDELVRNGVPANAIVVVARGESQPLVPTADGVREPQNRRVEIVLN